MSEEEKKVTEAILEASWRADKETWKETLWSLYWAIPFFASGVPITVHAFLKNTRKFREYAEKGIEEIREE